MYLYGVMLGYQGQDEDDHDVDYTEVLASTEEEARRHPKVKAIEKRGYKVVFANMRPRTAEEWVLVDKRYLKCVGCPDWDTLICEICFSSVNTLWGET